MFTFSVNEEYLASLATVDPDDVSYDEEERREREQREAERREMLGIIRDEYLDLIPPIEADILELLYSDNGITQKQIGEIFGFSQSAVNYRIGRAHDRIRYLHERPKLTAAQISARIAEWGEEYCSHEIGRCAVMAGMIWDSTCESDTAARLGVSQGTVLGHLRLLHRELKKVEPDDEITVWLGKMLSKASQYYRIGILHDSPWRNGGRQKERLTHTSLRPNREKRPTRFSSVNKIGRRSRHPFPVYAYPFRRTKIKWRTRYEIWIYSDVDFVSGRDRLRHGSGPRHPN